ncbi:MAG: tRNA pseudouridine(38-40) synthase TruA [Oscillospiraceae bacterium]
MLATLKFVGTAYHGSQIQANALTIQEVFQLALEGATGERPDVKLCSRTDSGVHAEKFCISFDREGVTPLGKLVLAINAHLPRDVRVISARPVSDDFHARYSARAKRYIYKVYNSRVLDPFFHGRAAQFVTHIDERKLDGIAKAFVGTHDFAAFCSIKTDAESTVRTVCDFSVSRDGELVIFSVCADGFLYNMVRIMAGTLMNAARGKLTRDDIERALETGVRTNRFPTAPACGLYLADVIYDEETLAVPE